MAEIVAVLCFACIDLDQESGGAILAARPSGDANKVGRI